MAEETGIHDGARRNAATPFDITSALPGPGVTLLEASAGTGKTFTITALIARYVAEGVPLDAILAVTFTRMATGELRDRVRRRLCSLADALGRKLDADEPVPGGDELAAMLANADRATLHARRIRLDDAVAAFDSATITTTHGFCQLVLDGLGTAGDVAARATLMEDSAALVTEVVDDLYLRWSLLHGVPDFRRDDARKAATAAIANTGISLASAPGDPPAELLRRLVSRASQEVNRRLAEDNLLSYDRLLSRLAETLESGERGTLACRRLRERYRVVLVDEFQDTDPVQWRVVHQAFGDRRTTALVLVGDPKQAIYSFRGADVHAYLQAAERATHHTLTVNWRADQDLLDATEALLSPLQMGDERIVFRSVAAPADRAVPGVENFPAQTPLRIRLVDERQPGIRTTPAKRLLQKESLVDWIAADVARDVAALIHAEARIADTGHSVDHAGKRPWRRVQCRDIAVLTRTNKQSLSIRNALRAAGVPAVIAGLDSVFASPAAGSWLRLLEAIEEPTSRSRVAALALTPWIGMTVMELAEADERTWEGLHSRAYRWAATLATRGVAALHRSITTSEGLPARVAGTAGGERDLTDLGHLAELLHQESVAGHMGVRSMRSWLARRIKEVEVERGGAEERSRRLDSDAEAVQVLTVHRVKGLEFGVVYCPYLWDGLRLEADGAPVVFHDPSRGGERTLDVGSRDRNGPARNAYQNHRGIALDEQRGEDLRVMYVALTRARHQVVLWWAKADGSRNSPLGRLLLCRDDRTGHVATPPAKEPKDDLIRKALDTLVGRARTNLIGVEMASDAPTPLTTPKVTDPICTPSLEVARFDRTLDLRWRRSSYTSITASAHGSAGADVGSEPEEPSLLDEPSHAQQFAGTAPGDPPVTDGPRCILADVPGGTEIGSLVHEVLERVDFAASDLRSDLEAAISSGRGASTGLDVALLAAGLESSINTPLGPLLPGTALRDISRRHRANELAFELPLAGGDRPSGALTTADIASVLARHVEPDGVLGRYPSRLADPILSATLRGYMTGSLDLVFRHGTAPGSERWYVVDYKTNRLSHNDVGAWPYRRDVLDEEMQHRHYPLQALIYLVALHRFLRWRIPGYSPGEHLGGVLYLFLRGMAGPQTPLLDGQPCGVWSWDAPCDLVVELSDLFAYGRAKQ